jgi:hypothetical protein
MPADSVRPEPTEPALPQLSWWSFGLALAITLVIFFLLNPMWHRLDMAQMDRNIAWSYAPIPLLVLGLLALERKLRWSSWMIETLRLTLVKFAVTFLFANAMWAIVGPPGATIAPATSVPTGGRPAPEAAPAPPEPTPIDPARTGRIEGVVTDAGGAPRAGVLVAVTGGLEAFVFARRPEGVALRHDGESLQPPAVVVQIGEPLTLFGDTDVLHTAAGMDGDGREVFHVPLVPGSARTLSFDRALGPVTVRCKVDGRAEHATALAIVDNPFAAWTGGDGRFRFEGVPAGELELTAFGPAGSRLREPVRLQAGTIESLTLQLP